MKTMNEEKNPTSASVLHSSQPQPGPSGFLASSFECTNRFSSDACEAVAIVPRTASGLMLNPVVIIIIILCFD
ncbi:hypothetical protein AAC387_Pa01g2278 [Persea americana]